MTQSTSHAITFRNAVLGAVIAGGLSYPLYRLTQAIIARYAEQPLPDSNQTAATIAVAVRTLVMGIGVLATAVFILVAVGLLLLAIQSGIQWLQENQSS
ncbi:hypothetical protein PCC7418_3358 [Halothece sp. PCC 7418]|uniref:DUF3082 domain-containing protein n=1 Tax=Halothece sp. (strain PCC 7418) TaxID=65093 RepID=UPI0002A0888F|nr:DUF3082 domain-containing protein [Halothece sp. PCC 7418]AFZ45473.1 hypothetical protein PCC7418_3358 [Halothece sp. PCC 7418]